MTERLRAFKKALDRHAAGYSEGVLDGRRWAMTIKRSPDHRRTWLFAEDLAGGDVVSFNLYHLAHGPVLKPCEMSSDTVVDFVLRFQPD